VVGAYRKGAAYVFVKPTGGWANATENAKLTASPSGGVFPGYVGFSVGVSGDTIVVGAPFTIIMSVITANFEQGAVYVYTKPSSGWASATQSATLTALNGAEDEDLGTSVAIAGDTVAAGAIGTTIGG